MTTCKVELFPAELFPGGEACEGFYRLRVDGAWLNSGAAKYEYYGPEGVGAQVTELLARLTGAATAPAKRDWPLASLRAVRPSTAKPELPRGTLVSVAHADQTSDLTRTATEPIQGIDGRWYVAVSLFGRGLVFVPVEDCHGRKL